MKCSKNLKVSNDFFLQARHYDEFTTHPGLIKGPTTNTAKIEGFLWTA
jgi:hypothetical protein